MDHWKCSNKGTVLDQTMECIRTCCFGLKDWNKATFGKIQKEINHCKKWLESYDLAMDRSVDPQQYKRVERNLEDLLDKEELAWKQRSRI